MDSQEKNLLRLFKFLDGKDLIITKSKSNIEKKSQSKHGSEAYHEFQNKLK